MNALLEEIKDLMERHNLSPAQVSKYIGTSEKTAYNWLIHETSSPRPVWNEKIRRAIRKIKREFEPASISLEINKYYRALWPKLKNREKDALLEIMSQSGGDRRPEYLGKLKELAAAHGIEIENADDKKGGR